MIYIYDGTYEGLLTAIFTSFEHREFTITLTTPGVYQEHLFDGSRVISTDRTKASRVYSGLAKRTTKNIVTDFWRAFLSEDTSVIQIIYELIIAVFRHSPALLQNYGDDKVILFHQALRKVSRERHRMKAFVRFHKSSNGLFVAIFEPDFNVLPLIVSFFRNRYADQTWLIYDQKRKYGLFYDLKTVIEVTLSAQCSNQLQSSSDFITLDPEDNHYENLWRSYFQSTNIEARKNLKLHIRHVPKRYWRYLPEKLDQLRHPQ